MGRRFAAARRRCVLPGATTYPILLRSSVKRRDAERDEERAEDVADEAAAGGRGADEERDAEQTNSTEKTDTAPSTASCGLRLGDQHPAARMLQT